MSCAGRVLVLWILLTSTFHATVLAGWVPPEQHEAKATLRGKTVVVALRMGEGGACEDPNNERWGTDGNCPQWIIASMLIQYGKQKVILPFSAYSDLSAVRSIEVNESKMGFTVTIHGGDAATGYGAVLEVSTEGGEGVPFVKGRTVRSSESPNETPGCTRLDDADVRQIVHSALAAPLSDRQASSTAPC